MKSINTYISNKWFWSLLVICIIVVGLTLQVRRSSASYKFEKLTGLKVTHKLHSIKEKDNYFLGEGNYYLVFITTPEQIQQWLKIPPPWNNEQWAKGAIPIDIGSHVGFDFPMRSALIGDSQGNWKYAEKNALTVFLADTNKYYSADGEASQFRSGSLLIFQTDSSKVYYESWNY